MTSVTYHDVRFMEPAKTRNYLNVDYGALSWLLSVPDPRELEPPQIEAPVIRLVGMKD